MKTNEGGILGCDATVLCIISIVLEECTASTFRQDQTASHHLNCCENLNPFCIFFPRFFGLYLSTGIVLPVTPLKCIAF
jgi:hypothetical protein